MRLKKNMNLKQRFVIEDKKRVDSILNEIKALKQKKENKNKNKKNWNQNLNSKHTINQTFNIITTN